MSTPETAWCPTCRTHREVMDTYDTDEGDRYGDRPTDRRPYSARPLECGHNAADGGSPPSQARPTHDPTLVTRVADLQRSMP